MRSTLRLTFYRPILGAVVLAVSLFGILATVEASTTPEAYVQELADKVTGVLKDGALSTEDKAAQLRQMIDQYLDVKRIALFALGKHRQDAVDQGVLDTYVTTFKEYAIGLYESRLSDYGGQSLKVTGSEDRNGKGKDFVVKSEIVGGNTSGDPLNVNWRVIKLEDGFTVVDVQIEGIWMALDLREQFSSIIANNGGKVQALIDHIHDSKGEAPAIQ